MRLSLPLDPGHRSPSAGYRSPGSPWLKVARVALAGALVTLASCLGDRTTTAEPEVALRHVRSLISDGAHSNGTPGFFFLPPVVSQPNVSGDLDADVEFVNPVVAICDVTDAPAIACGSSTPGSTAAVRTFTLASDPAITIDGDKYRLNWDTGDAAFVSGRVYRVYIFAGPARTQLGFADIVLTANRGQIKNHSGDVVALNDGRTLPIHFRIEQGVVPRAAPARSLHLDGLGDPMEAGTEGTITVTALDASGNVATGYTGTIVFNSTDASATLPATYTFTAADAGTHSFPVTLRGASTATTVGASDRDDITIAGSQTVGVLPAAAATLVLSEVPSQTTAGIASNLVVIALDRFGNTATGYRGTVSIASTDLRAMLPDPYTFQDTDRGVHSFGASVVFKTAGERTLTATDDAAPAIAGSVVTTVLPGAPAELRFTTQPSNTVSLETIAPAIVVTVYDAFGNQATNFNGFVTVGLHESGAVLFGTFDVRAVGGVATYDELIIVDVGTGYVLKATLRDQLPVFSAPFDITPAATP